MVRFILWSAIGIIVLFFIINGFYLKRDVEESPGDPFDEENKTDGRRGDENE